MNLGGILGIGGDGMCVGLWYGVGDVVGGVGGMVRLLGVHIRDGGYGYWVGGGNELFFFGGEVVCVVSGGEVKEVVDMLGLLEYLVGCGGRLLLYGFSGEFLLE